MLIFSQSAPGQPPGPTEHVFDEEGANKNGKSASTLALSYPLSESIALLLRALGGRLGAVSWVPLTIWRHLCHCALPSAL